MKKNGNNHKQEHITKEYLDEKLDITKASLTTYLDQRLEHFAFRYIMPLYERFDKSEKEMSVFKKEMYAFRDEMYAFKDDMRKFKSDVVISFEEVMKELKSLKKKYENHEIRTTALEDWAKSQRTKL